jgi:hypothetical protein
MEKEKWELWFERWYAETWGDGSNWIGAESQLARLAYLEATRAAGANEAATLTAIWSQLDAGDKDGAVKMIRARLWKIQPPMA